MPPKKVTINEVAHYAGVSISTVSLVLSGKGRISEKTAKKVKQAIGELGYIPNQAASSLRGYQTRIIGLILRDMKIPFYMEATSGLSEVLEKAGYMLFISQAGDKIDQFHHCLRTLQQQQVSGIVFSPLHNHQEQALSLIKESGIASLCISRASFPLPMDLACSDNSYGAAEATGQLITRGHRQIAYIGGHSDSLTRAERLAGYCSTLMKYNLPFQPRWILETDGQQQGGYEAIKQLLHIQPKITGIIFHNMETALGAIYGLKKSGRSIGQDIYIGQQLSLVVLEDDTGIKLMDTDLTVFKHSAEEIGRQAGERILQRIENPAIPSQRIMLKPFIV